MKWIAYNISRTGDINGRPVHTTRTYGPLKRPVRTGAKNTPVRTGRTAHTYG